MALANLKIGFIGAGSMAQGMIDGWIRANVVKPSQLMASAPSDKNLSKLRAKGLSTTHDNAEVVRSCSVVVIACKPYQCKDVLPALPFGPQHLVLSVVAGLRCPMHEAFLTPGTRFVRTMPNVAIAVCEGNISGVRGAHATDEDMVVVGKLMNPISNYEVMSDPQLDIMSSTAGTGVAWGTGKLYLETGKHPGEIKDSVCSPGGSTIRGVHALEKSGVRAAMMNAVEAAHTHVLSMSKM
eukprot:XP_791374.4 PREDICTED: pyrroline-5-carboxylate reductase 3 [Strongylocentrotus purpuratus]